MRLRPLNKSRRTQLSEHESMLRSRLDQHDRGLADRHGDGPIQRLNARLFAETLPANLPDVPERTELGSLQGVQIFRPVIFGDTVHPEGHQFFEPDELAAVEDEAAPVQVLNRIEYRHFDYVE